MSQEVNIGVYVYVFYYHELIETIPDILRVQYVIINAIFMQYRQYLVRQELDHTHQRLNCMYNIDISCTD